MNMENFLGTNKEIYLLCSHDFIIENTKTHSSSKKDSILFFPSSEEKTLIIATSNVNELIMESAKSADYTDNLFTKIKVNKQEEDKLLTLISLGFELQEAVYSLFIQGKENEFKWEKYRDYYVK